MTGVPHAMACSEVVPGRLVLAGADDQVSGPQQGRHRGVLHLAGEDHAVCDAQRRGELGQLDVTVVVSQLGLVGAADDQELGVGDPGQRPQQLLQRPRAPCRSAAVSSRGRPFRLATGPSGVNRSVSTPHGTIRIADRRTPRLARSATSAELVATTAAALRPMAGSSLIRAADAPSAFAAVGRAGAR